MAGERVLAKWGDFLRPSFGDVLAGGNVRVVDVSAVEDLIALGDTVDALFVRMPHHASRDVLAALPSLKVIAVPGAGLEVVDVPGATELGVAVVDGRGIGANTVVDWTLGSMVWLARDMGGMRDAMEQGRWEQRHEVEGRRDLEALTVGVVGYGAIGSRVAARAAAAFGCTVVVADAMEAACQAASDAGFSVADPDAVLASADMVTIHTQARQGAPPQFGEEQLRRMPRGSFVINTTRGQVLDYEALVIVLDDGHLAGAAIDVYPVEPPPASLVARLRRHRRVLLSPHQAGMTIDATEKLARKVAASVIAVLDGQRVDNCANPSVWNGAP